MNVYGALIQKPFYAKQNIRKLASEKTFMLPQHIPTLKGKEAKDFIDQDKKPLSKTEKAHILKCVEIYKKNPIE